MLPGKKGEGMLYNSLSQLKICFDTVSPSSQEDNISLRPTVFVKYITANLSGRGLKIIAQSKGIIPVSYTSLHRTAGNSHNFPHPYQQDLRSDF